MLLSSIAFSFMLSVPQVPVHEGPEAPKPEAQPALDEQSEFWKLQTKLVEGEWLVDEHFTRKIFHRFVNGPGSACIYVETRDKAKLFNPLPGLSVIFPDPRTGNLRGIEIADRGAFSESVYHWEGEMLIREYSYHLSDGSMRNGEVLESTMDLITHWSFEGSSAYKWELFQKTKAGVSLLLETSFAKQESLTTLPMANQATLKPSVPLTFLDPLRADHRASDRWFMTTDWRVKGMGLWVNRNMPNPNFGWDPTSPEILEVEGFYYWHPIEKTAKFIGFSKQGALVEGVTQMNGRQQIETNYTVGQTSSSKPALDAQPNPLGERIQTMEDGSLKFTWVSVGMDGKPTITEATMK
jgi:hypothetical protein